MLVCEATIFTCSALALRWQMADESLEGFQDMGFYTVMCAISTFSALTVTVLLLFVPTQVCSRLGLCALMITCELTFVPGCVACVWAGMDFTR